MIQEQDWTEAYKEMCRIVSPHEDKLTGIIEIKHIDLWNEQVDFLPEEYPFPPHSLFFQFTAESVKTIGGNAQEVVMIVDLIYVLDSLADTYDKSTTQDIAFEFIATCKKLHHLFQGRSGNNFSSMDRMGMRRIPAPPYLRTWSQSYRTTIMDYSGVKDMKQATITSATLSQGVAPAPNNDFQLFETNL